MKHAATTLGLLVACALLAGCMDSEGAQPAASGNWVGEGPAPAIEADRRYCRNLVAGQQVRAAPEYRDSARRHGRRSGARAYSACMEARGWRVQ